MFEGNTISEHNYYQRFLYEGQLLQHY